MIMRFYNQPHRFYCGGDLHARSLFLHILDGQGQTRFEKDLPACPEAFLEAIGPFRDGLVVGVECMFAWYWLADLCEEQGIPFVLGHALYMKAIHGGKSKNDRIDAGKIAGLLRGGLFPQAYVYPKAMRETRDLLRRRTFLVRQRAQFLTHIQNTISQYNLPPLNKKLSYAANRQDAKWIDLFPHESVQRSIRTDLNLIDTIDEEVNDLELYLTRNAKIDDPNTYRILRSVPGIGKVLSLIMLYEIHDIGRFPEVGNFASYSRLVRCEHESAGKVKGHGGRKIGNGHLKWAFSEAACLLLRCCEPAKKWMQRKEKKVGKATALGILSAKLGRTVYHLWRKQEAFDVKRFLTS
jgi:transposase